jgi:beta-glucosidase
MGVEDEITASVTLSNRGNRKGTEVVQLYIRDLVASVTRPVIELKGFQKVELEPGQSRKVEFQLTAQDFEFYGLDGRWSAEPGEFKIFIGSNSQQVKEASFVLN